MQRREATADLVNRARRHDQDAFGELYDLYVDRVYAFRLTYTHNCHLTYTHNCHDAEDVTSHTFEQALVAIDRYEDRGTPFIPDVPSIRTPCPSPVCAPGGPGSAAPGSSRRSNRRDWARIDRP